MRAYMRVCIGIAHPVQPGGSGIVAPFELADWLPVPGVLSSESTRARKRRASFARCGQRAAARLQAVDGKRAGDPLDVYRLLY
jgi:hypothetical protein